MFLVLFLKRFPIPTDLNRIAEIDGLYWIYKSEILFNTIQMSFSLSSFSFLVFALGA